MVSVSHRVSSRGTARCWSLSLGVVVADGGIGSVSEREAVRASGWTERVVVARLGLDSNVTVASARQGLVECVNEGGGETLLGYLVAEAKKRHRAMCARLRTPTRGTSRTTGSGPSSSSAACASILGESGGPAELEFMSLPAAALSSSSCHS